MSKKNRNQNTGEKKSENSPNDIVGKDADGVESGDDAGRRDFMKVAVAAGIGVCAIGTPICAGTRLALYPASLQGKEGKSYPLVPETDLTDKPQRFSIVDDKQDAWNLLKDQVIGTVFVHKKGDRILAFNADCPHAGCKIQYAGRPHPETAEVTEMYYCPCHAAHFDLDGKRLDKVSPRDLDALEVKVVDGVVHVQFQKFIFGITEKRT